MPPITGDFAKGSNRTRFFFHKTGPAFDFPRRLPLDQPPSVMARAKHGKEFYPEYILGWTYTMEDIDQRGDLSCLNAYEDMNDEWKKKGIPGKYNAIKSVINMTGIYGIRNRDDACAMGITTNHSEELLRLGKSANFIADAKEIMGQTKDPEWFLQAH